MINLIYVSSAVQLMSEAELVQILAKSRQNNARVNVTGMLLYHEGNFMQVLEGEEDAVMALYRKIEQDTRHHMVTLIATRPIKKRNFPEWEMGFTNLRDLDPDQIEGFSNYLSEPLNSEAFTQNPTFANAFLRTFREMLAR
ncbi:MAG: BLUF domain-containing protein [Aggregatilineales bacterium]